MKKSLLAALSLTLAASAYAQAQDAKPTWDLTKDSIDPVLTQGKIECVDGVVKLDGQNSFAVPAKALGAQNDYTIEFEVKRAPDAKGVITFVSNADEQNKTGIEFKYAPPAYNAVNLFINGNRTIEQRGFLSDKFDKVTVVAKDRKLTLFRNGLILAMTDEVKPSTLPLTFGSVEKAPTAPYELRNIKIYDTALFPTGFDKNVSLMRNYSGDQYFMQRVEVKDPTLPRILVVGDSISMGYRGTITQHFKGRAYVDYWVGGAWFAWTVKGDDFPLLRGWSGVLANGPYDVVTWNSMTLHMWSHDVRERCVEATFPAQMTRVVEHLLKTAPKTKFIWVRCTPVTTAVEGKPSVIRMDEKERWRTDRINTFNKMTDEIMAKYGIPEVDLHALCEKNLDKASKDGIHWNAEASRLMGEEIIKAIEARLLEKK